MPSTTELPVSRTSYKNHRIEVYRSLVYRGKFKLKILDSKDEDIHYKYYLPCLDTALYQAQTWIDTHIPQNHD